MPESFGRKTDLPKKLVVLGSTGSIGVNTLKIIEAIPERFSLVGISAGRNLALLEKQIKKFHPYAVAVEKPELMNQLRVMLGPEPPRILCGPEGIAELAGMDGVDTVVSAISGFAGLLPTLTAVKKGKRVALANKESMVVGGGLIVKAAMKSGAEIIPVDSEHSAVFQCLLGNNKDYLRRIILTASGGPFLNTQFNKLKKVDPQTALRHPKWKMGRKITVDSATFMNKALEIIEAKWLFNTPPEMIDVLIHPECIVHSMVEFADGSIIAQMGVTDMRIPISFALTFPERLETGLKGLNLVSTKGLHFIEPDRKKFPSLDYAYEALSACNGSGGTMPVVLNASNEEAVNAFLAREIGFMDIFKTIDYTLKKHTPSIPESIEDILDVDREAREYAKEYIFRRRRKIR